MTRIACAVLFSVADLYAQSAGIPNSTSRALKEVSEMGHDTPKASSTPRSLTFEQADDPTVASHPVTIHEPSGAARKAAQKGEHLAKKNRHDEAVEMYRAAVAADPLYYEAWNNLALELQAAGKIDEAIATFRHITGAAPEHVLGFTNFATLLCEQKRYAEAESVIREALKHHNYSYKANYLLGSVLINEGHWSEEARTKLEYAQVKYPEAKSLLDRWPKR